MRALKVSIAVMGGLILAIIVTIVVTLYNRTGGAPSGAPWVSALAAPAGAAIKDFRLDGDRLAVRVGRAGGGDTLYLIDLRRGDVIGTVKLKNER